MVTFVTPLVKSATFPMTFEEKVWTPPTIDAAKSAPGSCGIETPPPDGWLTLPPVETGATDARPNPGS